MNLTITFGHQTVKALDQHLHAAFRVGDLPRIKRITALLMLADQRPAPVVADRLGVGRSTVYAWLHAFLVDRLPVCRAANPLGVPPN